jgi:hypothetical protein
MGRYRKLPVEIDAVQWTGDNFEEIRDFAAGEECPAQLVERGWVVALDGGDLYLSTLEGVMTPAVGDWIIRGVAGEYYSCKPDIFARTYESAERNPELSRLDAI